MDFSFQRKPAEFSGRNYKKEAQSASDAELDLSILRLETSLESGDCSSAGKGLISSQLGVFRKEKIRRAAARVRAEKG